MATRKVRVIMGRTFVDKSGWIWKSTTAFAPVRGHSYRFPFACWMNLFQAAFDLLGVQQQHEPLLILKHMDWLDTGRQQNTYEKTHLTRVPFYMRNSVLFADKLATIIFCFFPQSDRIQ